MLAANVSNFQPALDTKSASQDRVSLPNGKIWKANGSRHSPISHFALASTLFPQMAQIMLNICPSSASENLRERFQKTKSHHYQVAVAPIEEELRSENDLGENKNASAQ